MPLHCRFPRACALVAALALSLCGPSAHAQKPPASVSEKLSEAIVALRPLQEAKSWDAMLARLDAVPDVKPGSYDAALILDMKARIYGMMEQPGRTIAPWEEALKLSDEHGYFPERQTLEIVLMLAQIHGREAALAEEPARKHQHFEKAVAHFRRYLAHTPKPPPEVMVNYTSILFYKATADPQNIDPKGLTEARSIIERGLTLNVKPREEFYQLLLGLLQQENDLERASEVLELLLKQKPEKRDYWQVLAAIYVQLAEKTKERDRTLSHEYLVRAIVTYERARALGFLTGSKENLHLATLHLMANQFTKGTELLYSGLKNGDIESDPNHWRLLGRFYQEAYLNREAAAVLNEATQLFPQNGEIEMQLAQLYIQMERNADALRHAQAAAAKGNFETIKPFAVHHLIAHTAYLENAFDAAQQAIAAAEKFPDDAAKDPQFSRLKDAIDDALKARALEAEAKEKKQRPTEGKTAQSR